MQLRSVEIKRHADRHIMCVYVLVIKMNVNYMPRHVYTDNAAQPVPHACLIFRTFLIVVIIINISASSYAIAT